MPSVKRRRTEAFPARNDMQNAPKGRANQPRYYESELNAKRQADPEMSPVLTSALSSALCDVPCSWPRVKKTPPAPRAPEKTSTALQRKKTPPTLRRTKWKMDSVKLELKREQDDQNEMHLAKLPELPQLPPSSTPEPILDVDMSNSSLPCSGVDSFSTLPSLNLMAGTTAMEDMFFLAEAGEYAKGDMNSDMATLPNLTEETVAADQNLFSALGLDPSTFPEPLRWPYGM